VAKAGEKGDKGDTGADGLVGKDGVGIKSTVVTYQLGTSGTTKPTSTWSSTVPTLVKGQYLWTKTTWNYSDSTSEDGYQVTYIGKDGNNGSDGIAGKDGTGIKSTQIDYVVSTSGTVKPVSGWQSTIPTVNSGQYLWTRTTWSYTDNTSEVGYSVAKAGETGPKGDKGDSGADGVAGKDGIGIKSTAITYALGDSGTSEPTTGWTTSVPSLVKGKYLWTKTVWLYTDNTSESGYSTTYIGKDGNDGNNGLAGKDGVGISATKVEYVGSTSGTTKPTSGWLTTVPSVAAGSFLWTKTTWSYTDGTSESGYSVAKAGETGPQGLQGLQGLQGPQGNQGPKGLDGKSSYTHIAYATSASGNGFTQTPTATTTHIGMYVDQTATDSTDPSSYQWTLIKGADGATGIPGKAGADGKTPYLHTAYSWSADGTDRFTNAYPTENLFSMNLISGNSKMQPGTLTTPGAWGYHLIEHEQLIKMLKPGKTYSVHYGFELLSRATGTTPQREPSHGTLLLYSGISGYPTVKLGGTLNNFGDANTWVIGTKRVRDENFVTPTSLYDEASNYCIIYYTMRSLNSDGTFNCLENGRFYDIKFSEIGSLTSQFPIYTPSPTDDPINAYPSYRGEYTDYTEADSDDPSKYTWAKLRGEAGKSIKTFSTEYYLSSSSVEQTDGSWTSVLPTKTPATYIWYRNLITYTDNSTAISDPVLDDSANNFYTITETNTSNISRLNDRITKEVSRVRSYTGPFSMVTSRNNPIITKDGKKLRVSNGEIFHYLRQLKSEENSSIEQTAQSIRLEVYANYETKDSASGHYQSLKSEIDQTADKISLQVTKNEIRKDFAESTESSITISSGVIDFATGGLMKFVAGTLSIDTPSFKLDTSNTLSINTTNFKLDAYGNVSIAGEITATSGTIGGWTINSNSLSGSGTITGGSITGSVISGTTINGGTIKGATITGGTVTGSTIKFGTNADTQITAEWSNYAGAEVGGIDFSGKGGYDITASSFRVEAFKKYHNMGTINLANRDSSDTIINSLSLGQSGMIFASNGSVGIRFSTTVHTCNGPNIGLPVVSTAVTSGDGEHAIAIGWTGSNLAFFVDNINVRTL
jgi:hypothetical protein